MKKNYAFLILSLFIVYGVSVHGAGETIIKNGLISRGSVYTTDTTQSTTKDNGSMVTEGGMGIEKNLNIGGSLGVIGTIQANASVVHLETGGGSDTVSLQAPASVTSSYVMKWPVAQGGSSTYLMNDGSGNLSFTTVSAGSSSLSGWSGAHGTDCSWSRTNISLGDPAADSSCTFTEIVNLSFGSVTSYLSGSDKLPGIVFTPVSTGTYWVVVNFTSQSNTNGAIQYLRLQETGGTIIGEQAINLASSGEITSVSLSGLYTAGDTSAKTIKLTIAANGAAQTTIASAGATTNYAVMWTITKIQ